MACNNGQQRPAMSRSGKRHAYALGKREQLKGQLYRLKAFVSATAFLCFELRLDIPPRLNAWPAACSLSLRNMLLRYNVAMTYGAQMVVPMHVLRLVPGNTLTNLQN